MTPREQKIVKFFKKWEGGYSNHPADKGGPTMMGITLKTFQSYYGPDKTAADLKKMTEEQWLRIFKNGYYNKMKCGQIEDDSTALLCCDMGWGSGPVTAIKKIQACLGCQADGIIGPKTLAAVNGKDRKAIFEKLWQMRKAWFEAIVKANPSQKVFLKGWLNRLNDIKNVFK